jgi:hypothetical protein
MSILCDLFLGIGMGFFEYLGMGMGMGFFEYLGMGFG